MYPVSRFSELEIKPLPESNQSVVVGTVETNEAAFHPCLYTKLSYTDNEETSHNLFVAKKGVSQNPNIEVGIIAGSEPKNFKYKIGGTVETKDCIYEDQPHDHEKQMFFYDESSVPANFTVDNNPRKLSGTAKFDYGGDIFNYIWPAKPISGEFPSFVAHANSCRYSKTIKTVVYPNIQWELAFIISTGESSGVIGGKSTDGSKKSSDKNEESFSKKDKSSKSSLLNYPKEMGLKFKDKFTVTDQYKGFGFEAQFKVKTDGDVTSFSFENLENTIKRLLKENVENGLDPIKLKFQVETKMSVSESEEWLLSEIKNVSKEDFDTYEENNGIVWKCVYE